MKPDITIILPVHNNEDTIQECLHSILIQTLTNFEIIIIDDGSTDKSINVIHQFANQDNRIILLQPGRVGLVNALNIGISNVRGKLIARMDGDDTMHPERLEKQCQFLTHNTDTGLISCRAHLFPKNLIKQGYIEYMEWQNNCLTTADINNQIYVESPFAHPSVMFRKTILDQVGVYHKGDFPEDYELWLRFHHAGIKMCKLPDYLLDWRESPNRTSRTDTRYKTTSFDKLRANFLAKDNRIPRDRPIVIWGAGKKSRRRAQLLLQQGFTINAWVDVDPNKIGNTIQGVPVKAHTWLTQTNKPFILNYVNNHGARVEVETYLNQTGYQVGLDYLSVG